jgi:hypothetical protein
MKKTLVAVAALAALGAAFAEITPYAVLDAGVTNNGTTTQVGSGYSGSQVGLKGNVDMGSGLKGVFQVEGDINAALGNANPGFSNDGLGSPVFTGEHPTPTLNFRRLANAGVSGSMGTVKVGVDYTPFDNAACSVEPAGCWGSVVEGGKQLLGQRDFGNAGGSISYTTPTVGGFSLMLATTPQAGYPFNGQYNSVWAHYAAGPIDLHYATQNDGKFTDNVFGGNYNLGAAKVYVAVANSNASGSTVTQTAYGLSVPVAKSTFNLATSTTGHADGNKTTTGAQFLVPLGAATGYVGFGVSDGVNNTYIGARMAF